MVESTTEYDWPELPDDIARTLVAAAAELLDYLDGPRTTTVVVEEIGPLIGTLDPQAGEFYPLHDDDDPELAVQLDPTTRAEIAAAARTPDHYPLGYLTLIDGARR